MQQHSFGVDTTYHQFYLWDANFAQEEVIDWSPEDVVRRVKVLPNIVVIAPVGKSEILVEVQIHDSVPGYEMADWDHIVECSLEMRSGHLQVRECLGEPVANFRVQPGSYRVRVLCRALSNSGAKRLEDADCYTLVLWPAPESPLEVVKQWNPPASLANSSAVLFPELQKEAERATNLLCGRVVQKVWRHRANEVVVIFQDGAALFVNIDGSGLDLSITANEEDESEPGTPH